MSTRNRVGYCPICKQDVLLVREALNWPLIIILIIFTGGIGLIVYAIVYHNKPESYCIHCHTQTLMKSNSNLQSSSYSQIESQKTEFSDSKTETKVEAKETSNLNYCSFCGEPQLNEIAKFCPHCGTKA